MNELKTFGRSGAYINFKSMNKAWTKIFEKTGRRDHKLCQGCGRFHAVKELEEVCIFAARNHLSKKKARRILKDLIGG